VKLNCTWLDTDLRFPNGVGHFTTDYEIKYNLDSIYLVYFCKTKYWIKLQKYNVSQIWDRHATVFCFSVLIKETDNYSSLIDMKYL